MKDYRFRVCLKDFSKVLQGRISGMRHLSDVCVKLADVPHGTPIVLDFLNVKLVTG
jgi:hypothetical protein